MAANIDTMFSVREVPWHGLGTIVDAELLSEDAIVAAGLGWDVEKRRIQIPLEGQDVDYIEPTEWLATVRMDRLQPLGIVSPRYKIIQNREAFQFMDELAGPSRLLQYNTAGSLSGGRKVWLLATIQDLIMEPVKGDVVQPYLLLANGHDGKFDLSVCWTSVRVVCQNTLMLALGSTQKKVSIRHTGDLSSKKSQAQDVLGLTRKAVRRNEEMFKHLAEKKMDQKKLDEFLKSLVPDPEDGISTRAENVRSRIESLFDVGPGADLPGVHGTAWAALNAVTAYTSHYRTVRGEKEESERRLDSIWFGTAAAMNQRAVDLLVPA